MIKARATNTTLIAFGMSVAFLACAPHYEKSLPAASSLGNPRGLQIVRAITHMHSPYSYDACDGKGLSNNIPDQTCLNHLRDAACFNRIDYIFMTDHPNHMQDFEMESLLLANANDQLVYKNGIPYANRIGTCSNSFSPTLLVGFESKILALGMTQHLEVSISARDTLYQQDTITLRNRLANDADALVFAPHTESKNLDWIRTLQPDGIEIYNFHANVDPRIRNTLQLPPFLNIAGILTYLIDPYNQLQPDLSFLNFIEHYPSYFSKWNSLIDSGLKVVGVGGTDSHENIFPQIVSDHERLDAHRRILRMMSNHVLVNTSTPEDVKLALKNGQSWVVFEGLGSPKGMDFYANTVSATVGVGNTGSLSGSAASITIKAPTLAQESPRGSSSPIIHLYLKKVLSGGNDQIMASSIGADLSYVTSTPGAYRAEIAITPYHLKDYLGPFSDKAKTEYKWIITNHLYLTP